MRVYAYIMARSGSKGLPHKNIKDVGGHPLLAYSIAFARKLNLDRAIVSTDSSEYLDIARRYGADCPYLRGAAASTDAALDDEIMADFEENLPKLGIAIPDIWVRLKPTCPFRSVASVDKAIQILKTDLTIDSVRITSESDSRLQVIGEDGFMKPLLPSWDPTKSIVRRSDFPKAYKPFNLDVFRHANWRAWREGFMGARIMPIVEHKITGLDIDDADDFEVVRAIITARPRPAFLEPYIHDPQPKA